MEIFGLEKIRWLDLWSQKTSTGWRNKLLWWVAIPETLWKSSKDTLSGKEEFLCLSQPLHFPRGGEDSHGGQGEHWIEAWSTLVQVNFDKLCKIQKHTDIHVYIYYSLLIPLTSGWGRKEQRLLPWPQPLLRTTSGTWRTISLGKSEISALSEKSSVRVRSYQIHSESVPRRPVQARKASCNNFTNKKAHGELLDTNSRCSGAVSSQTKYPQASPESCLSAIAVQIFHNTNVKLKQKQNQ